MHSRVLSEDVKGRDHLENLSVHGNITLYFALCSEINRVKGFEVD
jgi:hypothetical protein